MSIIKISESEINWNQNLNSLIEFRNINPKSWPQVQALDNKEKKLGIWCRKLRKDYKNKILKNSRIEKLLAINFDLNSPPDTWKRRFDDLKDRLNTNQATPRSDSDLYRWGIVQYKKFQSLSLEKQKLLNSINFQKYYGVKIWDNRFIELKKYILLHNKIPSQKENRKLHYWITSQKNKFRRNRLTEYKLRNLIKLGIDLTPADNREDIWNLKFDDLKKFREKNPGRWSRCDGDAREKALYQWCQTQRQINAKTASGRKKLPQSRIDKLNQIGFHWTLGERIEKNWEENFKKLTLLISENNGSLAMPRFVNGKYNKLYIWLQTQKKMINENKLSVDKIERLNALGILKRH